MLPKIAALLLTVASTTGCAGTSPPANALGLTRIVGKDLVGARGLTPADQRKIDRTVVGICEAGVWGQVDCQRHGELTQ